MLAYRARGNCVLDAAAIVIRLISDIRCVYNRPLQYGGTAEGVGLVLHNLHATLAMVLEVEEQHRTASDALREQEGHQAMSCSGHYASKYPQATEEEKAAYVVACFRRLDTLLRLDAIEAAIRKAEPGVGADSR